MRCFRFVSTAVATLCLYILFCGNALACTLYGAAGSDYVEGGGVLFAKVRDWEPQEQVIRYVQPQSGYRYFGLFTGKFNVLGINEYGLAAGMSTAGTVSKDERKKGRFRSPEGLRINEYILRYCRTVDEALALPESFWKGAANILLGDRSKVAVVEILPDGKRTVRETDNGTLAHTNHYLEPASADFNKGRIGPSSVSRYERIQTLLSESKPLSMEDFIRFSEDRHAGPDNSIWRTGSCPQGTQTLAAFVIHTTPTGETTLYLKYREHPDDRGQEKVLRLSLQEALSTSFSQQER